MRDDYGHKDRQRFLHNDREYSKMDKYLKWVLLFGALYFLGHMAFALALEPVIINTPTGGQVVCIVDGRYVTCY